MHSIKKVCQKCYGDDRKSEIALSESPQANPVEERYFDVDGVYHHHKDVVAGTWKCSNGHHGTFIQVARCSEECGARMDFPRFVLSYD